MSDQSFARLEQAFSQTDLEGPPGRLDGARENRGGLAVLLLHLKEDVNMNWKRVAEGLIWDFAYTLRKQQEAEARATEAAAEAGKWKAEARAHAARFAVLEKADAAPYCEGQCGICDYITAPVAQPACSNCKHTDWEELAPGVGCNICQGL